MYVLYDTYVQILCAVAVMAVIVSIIIKKIRNNKKILKFSKKKDFVTFLSLFTNLSNDHLKILS